MDDRDRFVVILKKDIKSIGYIDEKRNLFSCGKVCRNKSALGR